MKKVLFTAVAAMAFAFAMTACNNNQPAEAAEDTTVAVADECDHHCAMDSTCNHECQCGDECKAKAAVEGQACEKACEHKCAKEEGKECCKKAEGKECEHKCQK